MSRTFWCVSDRTIRFLPESVTSSIADLGNFLADEARGVFDFVDPGLTTLVLILALGVLLVLFFNCFALATAALNSSSSTTPSPFVSTLSKSKPSPLVSVCPSSADPQMIFETALNGEPRKERTPPSASLTSSSMTSATSIAYSWVLFMSGLARFLVADREVLIVFFVAPMIISNERSS
jgi:hypothetical protein